MRSWLWLAFLAVAVPAFGAGEMPFPFEGQNKELIGRYQWDVEGLDLRVEAKLYLSKINSDKAAKIWIRGADGYVWDRVWTREQNGVLEDAIEINGVAGWMRLELAEGGVADLRLDGRRFYLMPVKEISPDFSGR